MSNGRDGEREAGGFSTVHVVEPRGRVWVNTKKTSPATHIHTQKRRSDWLYFGRLGGRR